MSLQKIIRKSKIQCANVGKFGLELALVSLMITSPNQDYTFGNYNSHILRDERSGQIAVDAKYLKSQNGQNGRGPIRYIFDRKTREFQEIAQEEDSGKYRTLVSVKDGSFKSELDRIMAEDIGYTRATIRQAINEIERIELIEENMKNGLIIPNMQLEELQQKKYQNQSYINEFLR